VEGVTGWGLGTLGKEPGSGAIEFWETWCGSIAVSPGSGSEALPGSKGGFNGGFNGGSKRGSKGFPASDAGPSACPGSIPPDAAEKNPADAAEKKTEEKDVIQQS